MDRAEVLACFADERARLLATLARLVGPADAEDLANETLMRALDAVEHFRAEAALGTWLHRIAINLAHDFLRRNKRQCQVDDPAAFFESEIASGAPVGEEFERRQMSQCVRKLMTKLSPSQREVLVQADMDEQRVSALALQAGLSVGNAKIRLHRARRAMKDLLDTHCQVEPQAPGRLCCVPKKPHS